MLCLVVICVVRRFLKTINVRFLAFGQAVYINRMQQNCNKTVEDVFGVYEGKVKI